MASCGKIWPSTGNPDLDFFQKTLYDEFSRHLVCISVRVTYLENSDHPGMQDEITCSGFVISIKDAWIVATAGHFLDGLDESVREKRFRVDEATIADFFGPEATVAHVTPFTIMELPKAY